ncbi:hypothetical protein DM860_003556 [Cuscuta australis]|uniref:Uncharacterized protein n=1 Tax=Cuscuta australis TaxID=267555 RepID=A0A328DGF5_9ASTE|nr:hypothetical protein DM860_003556 [Cuscuta australis]
MKAGANPILLHPSIQKSAAAFPRTLALIFTSFFAFAIALSLISGGGHAGAGGDARGESPAPDPVVEALVHYATANVTLPAYARMSAAEVGAVAAALGQCGNACNFLVFGLNHETLLWKTLNGGGRTVFVDESAYWAARYEEKHRGIEAYDVHYSTKVSELYHLLEHAKEEGRKECRPVQNLLYSDCKLALNDLPNHIYDVPWDVILVDGPRGWPATAPGRASVIFTAGVLSRSKTGGAPATHVFVHEIYREVERVSSDRFLCRGNLVNSVRSLGHFRVPKQERGNCRFCSPAKPPLSSSSSPSSSKTGAEQ